MVKFNYLFVILTMFQASSYYLLLMPILTISCPLGEDPPPDVRNTRSAQQAFQTNFDQFGEVKDSGDWCSYVISMVVGYNQCMGYINSIVSSVGTKI